jgi:hypothetical protein
MSSKNYELELMKLCNLVKEKVENLSKRHKVLSNVIYEDLDVMLSEDSEYFNKKTLVSMKDNKNNDSDDHNDLELMEGEDIDKS